MQLSMSFGEPYENRGLFASHFLRERVTGLPAWDDVSGLDEAFEAIASLYRRQAHLLTDATNEAQTERDFIRPILDLLWSDETPGDCYDVQVSLPNLGVNARQPDYALFLTPADRAAAAAHRGSIDYWRTVACVADAKRWGASLDRVRGEENPSAQVAGYLYRSRVRWGILTNGRFWRLYERERSSAGGVWYEVDLVRLLTEGTREDFRWFHQFFARRAFLPDATGRSFVEQVFEGSVTYATEVGDRLKDSVYDALRLLMTAFLEYRPNRLDRHDPTTLRRVHDNALIVLYRLLFIFYAEDRGLLPCDESPYRAYSLRELQREVNRKLLQADSYQPFATGLWCRLCDLFRLIDQGYPEGGMPEYNGGLFSPAAFPEIAYVAQDGCRRWEAPDHLLAQVIDLLAYERRPGASAGHSDIDYATLAVQHLGSIYEGLLELKPRLASEPLVEVVRGGRSAFQPAAQVPSPDPNARRIEQDGVYLVTDRGERKATGSFYTPKYIVDYIVEHTVGPLVDAAARRVSEMRPAVQAEVAELERRRQTMADSSLESERRQAADLGRQIETVKARLLEPYLTLKVLDPAMGSGHFLVGAADFLSLAMATDPNLPPPADIGGEEPQFYYKRLAVEHCLYGVDLNPLAVELAKLSLWLHTVSRGKALSFLDHHLRCGNSLLGASLIEDLATEPPRLRRGKAVRERDGQMAFAFTETLRARQLQYLLDTFRRIAEAPAGDAAAERAKAHWYAEMDAVRERFRQVANLWLAPYFGVEVTAEQYGRAVAALRDGAFAELAGEEWFVAAQAVAAEKRFFHWELEFPEAFLSPAGPLPEAERGFDAVICNPPYVRVRTLKRVAPDVASYYEACGRYRCATHVWDVYMLVAEQGAALARPAGRVGLIVPIQTLHQPNNETLRSILLDETGLERVLDLAELAVFDEALVKTCVLVYAPARPGGTTVFEKARSTRLREADRFTVAQARLNGSRGRSLKLELRSTIGQLAARLESGAEPLSHRYYATFGLRSCAPGRGQGGKDRLVCSDPRPADAVPYLEGREIGRYSMAWRRRYLRYVPAQMYSPRSPALFEQPKIVAQSMLAAKRLVATYDGLGFYVEQSLVCIVPHGTLTPAPAGPMPDLLFVLALLNSALLSFYFATRVIGDSLGGGLIHATPGSLRQLPIRRIAFTTARDERTRLAEEGHALYDDGDMQAVLAFAVAQLEPTPERADVVHDLLAHLAGQMVAMHRARQEETTGFLAWLETQLGAPIDELSSRTKIRAYADHTFDTLLTALKGNRRRLAVDPTAREFVERLRLEYGNSLAKLRPLSDRIEATDRLIDAIVYRLYGLSEDEIALVESEG